jgi:hypothetical protein
MALPISCFRFLVPGQWENVFLLYFAAMVWYFYNCHPRVAAPGKSQISLKVFCTYSTRVASRRVAAIACPLVVQAWPVNVNTHATCSLRRNSLFSKRCWDSCIWRMKVDPTSHHLTQLDQRPIRKN